MAGTTCSTFRALHLGFRFSCHLHMVYGHPRVCLLSPSVTASTLLHSGLGAVWSFFFFFLGVSAVTVEHEKAFRGSSQNGFSLLSCLTCLNTTTMMAYILNVRESRHRRRALFLRADQIFHVSVADKQYIMNFTNGRGLSFRADPLAA